MSARVPSREDADALRLLRDALELDTDAEREHLLAAHANTDPAVVERVRAMLRRAVDRDDCSREDAVLADAGRDPLPGARLGPFVVLERIGRGGMGVVYRGRRAESDFAQDVAIKLIRRGFDFDDVQARFLRERRILAKLEHPHLARFIDGGLAPDGRPWFALEFVQGETVTRWCDGRRLDLRARVRLFLDVCAAIQYAHSQLVVHRDLKPANILVDAEGRAKLLDFGIAKLVGGDDEPGATLTLAGQQAALTPEYAAPEQFSGTAGAGVTSDVYALGVVLYELLGGALPYSLDRNDRAAMEHTVRQQPPQPLAQAITRDGATAASARLAERATGLPAYRREVAGDLERILGKALAKEPERRYATVQALADDLSDWLEGRPVRVSGHRPGYRLAKFIGRHRAAVAFAALAATGTAAGVVATVWQARQAIESARHANAMRTWLVELFESGVPGSAAERVPDARTLIDRGAQRARSELRDQPMLQADMLATLGRIHNQLGLHAQAEPLLLQALEVRRTLGRERSPEAADVLLDLALVERRRQRLDAAAAHLREALAITIQHGDPAREAAVRQLAGIVSGLSGRTDEGVREARRAIDLLQQIERPAGSRTAAALNGLGVILYQARRYDEALVPWRDALALYKRLHGDTHVHVAGLCSNIGDALRELGRLDEAEAMLREAIAVDARVYLQPDPAQATHLGNLAALLGSRDRFEEAEQLMRKALQIRSALYGEGSPQAARSLINLGLALARQGKLEEGITVYRRAQAIFVDAPGEWRNERAYLHQNLAQGLSGVGDWIAAESEARAALALRLELEGEDGRETTEARAMLGSVLLASGRATEAREHYARALTSDLGLAPRNEPRLAERHLDLARAEDALGHSGQARSLFAESLRLGLAALGASHSTVVDARLGYAVLLDRLGEAVQANEQLDLAREATRALASTHPLKQRVDATSMSMSTR